MSSLSRRCIAVTLVVASSGHLSGAHINPAVTIGFWSIGRFRSAEVVPYVAAQCAGAVAASLLLGWILGPVGDFGATVPSLPLAQIVRRGARAGPRPSVASGVWTAHWLYWIAPIARMLASMRLSRALRHEPMPSGALGVEGVIEPRVLD